MRWDPLQYTRYADERGRPFAELLARVRADRPGMVVDLGCGPGSLTADLLTRWPQARIVGVDSSTDMVEAAREHAVPGRLDFVEGDVRTWRPDGPVDVIVANAVFQWVPGHLELLPQIGSWLGSGGELAFQVPDNFDEPSHTLLRDIRLSARWRGRLGDSPDRGAAVEPPDRYLRAFADLGYDVDVWQTTYLHVLTGADPVLEWVKGTALRPVLTMLDDPAEQQEFLADYGAALAAAYPPQPWGTVFPFRRTFVVARLPSIAR